MKEKFTHVSKAIFVFALVLLAMALMSSESYAQHVCAVEDSDFATADGGCKDLATGVVWSSLNAGVGSIWSWASADNFCDDSTEGGFSDWRLGKLGQFGDVYTNGAGSHFNIGGLGRYFWTSKKQGQWAWTFNLATAEELRIPTDSATVFICVRTTGDDGGMGMGGCMGMGC